MSKITRDNVKDFLQEYAKSLQEFELPKEDFPLSSRIHMVRNGQVTIHTSDGRHIATLKVEGDNCCPSMPLGPATLAYGKLFCELSNAFAEVVYG